MLKDKQSTSILEMDHNVLATIPLISESPTSEDQLEFFRAKGTLFRHNSLQFTDLQSEISSDLVDRRNREHMKNNRIEMDDLTITGVRTRIVAGSPGPTLLTVISASLCSSAMGREGQRERV